MNQNPAMRWGPEEARWGGWPWASLWANTHGTASPPRPRDGSGGAPLGPTVAARGGHSSYLQAQRGAARRGGAEGGAERARAPPAVSGGGPSRPSHAPDGPPRHPKFGDGFFARGFSLSQAALTLDAFVLGWAIWIISFLHRGEETKRPPTAEAGGRHAWNIERRPKPISNTLLWHTYNPALPGTAPAPLDREGGRPPQWARTVADDRRIGANAYGPSPDPPCLDLTCKLMVWHQVWQKRCLQTTPH